MRFVYVLEDDPKFIKEITEALLAVDPKVQVRQFRTLELFVQWLKLMMLEGPKAIKRGGLAPAGFTFEPVPESEVAHLQVVISKVEFLGPRQLGLMKKTRDLFVRQKICTQEDPTAFVLTAFEDPNFKVDELKDRILSNIMMKPFDRLILQQHLTFALDGRHPPSKHAVAPYKTKAVIEVLKTIEMEVMSPIGFVTRSNRALPPGAVAKYYARMFISERQRSMIAKMIDCRPDPNVQGEFIATFSYFGADQTQISSLRRRVLESKAKKTQSLLSPQLTGQKQTCRIVFVEDRQEVVQTLESLLKRKIRGAEFVHYRTLREFLMEVDPKLDTEAQSQGKPFGDKTGSNLEVTAKGEITLIGEEGIKFAGEQIQVGSLITKWMKDSAKAEFMEWLKNSAGSFLGPWTFGEKTFLIKITPMGGIRYLVEEASSADKEDYAKRNSKIAKGWDFLFASHRFVGPERIELWKELLNKAKGLGGQGEFRMFLVAATEFSDSEERALAVVFDDLFFVPIERVYIMQKLIMFCSALEILDDPISIISLQHKEEIKSARPAEIEELSEAGLVMKYDRAMSVGSFREFVLWQPYEIDAPEINATCNFSEESGEKNVWKLHFVFFAIKDTLLKAIRSWILENYVLSKDQGN